MMNGVRASAASNKCVMILKGARDVAIMHILHEEKTIADVDHAAGSSNLTPCRSLCCATVIDTIIPPQANAVCGIIQGLILSPAMNVERCVTMAEPLNLA